MNYKLSRRAKQDVREIYAYTLNTHGIAQADAYLMSIYDGFHRLSDAPEIGRIYRTVKEEEFRKLLFNYHNVYYQITNTGLEIRRILHVARDVTSLQDEDL